MADYTLTYDSNGGSPADLVSTETAGATITPSDGLWATRAGYVITEWNTLANGSGTAYPLDQTFVMPAQALTLYGQWDVQQIWDGQAWVADNQFDSTGKLELPASVAGAASLNIPVGIAPSAAVVGDIWHANDGLYYRNSNNESIALTLGARESIIVDIMDIY